MWQPNNEYKPKHEWEPHEDKALLLSWGLTSIEEIAEAFMCSCYNVFTRARILGLVPGGCTMLSAQHIENMVRLFDSGATTEHVSSLYKLPDQIYRYKSVPANADSQAGRELQDYYSKSNKNQLDMFGVADEGEDE